MATIDRVHNEDLMKEVAKDADSIFNLYKSQRSDHEEVWEVADYMARAAQNRTITESEKNEGANLPDDTALANTGSTLFFRQYRQLAAAGISVQTARPRPFKYSPIINENVFTSAEEGNEQANQMNVLAKWTMKMDHFDEKSTEFWHQLTKYGNVPIMMYQEQEWGERMYKKPVYREIDRGDGTQEPVLDHYEEERGEYLVKNYPAIKSLPIDSVYADFYGGDLPKQDCVVVVSINNKEYFKRLARADLLDEEMVNKLGEKYKWDGSTEKELLKSKIENENITQPSTATDLFLTFDVFRRLPLDDENLNWDDPEVEEKIYWMTFVGNSITEGLPLRFEENPDPDDEIPIKMVHHLPDDAEKIYHIAMAQIVRSNYSVECTLKNQAIDNASLICRPPLKAVEGEVRATLGGGKDFSYKPGQMFLCESNVTQIEEMPVKETVQTSLSLLEYIKNDDMTALNTDKPFMGESYGARTSATEAQNAYQSALRPQLAMVKYVLNQYLGFYAKKMKSYWGKYKAPGQVVAITDETDYPIVRPEEIHGEFDIQIDVADEFENDLVQEQQLNDTIRLIGEVPDIAKNIDIPGLMIEYLRRRKLPISLVRPPEEADSAEIARQESITMLEQGQVVQIREGENLYVHLREHQGKRLEYKGLEDSHPEVQILDRHIEETKAAIANKFGSQGGGAGTGGTPSAATGNKTPGQAGGNAMAAAMGG